MKYFVFYPILLCLVTSCAPPPKVAALPDATPTSIPVILPESTATVIPFTATTVAPTQVLCDPHTVDYCISDGHFILQRPIQPPNNDSVDTTYRYASTADGARELHHGVEFLNKFGTPVYAAADGVVVFAGPDTDAIYSPRQNFYGNMIVLRHANDLFTLYAHLSTIDVRQGEAVDVGTKIGEVGQSGAATGSHLHFEVRRGNEISYFSTENPELWLMPKGDENGRQLGAMMFSILDQDFKYVDAAFTVRLQPATTSSKTKSYYVNTYSPDLATGDENAALSDMPTGRYRIALKLNGHLYERWVEVQSGKLTQVVFVVE